MKKYIQPFIIILLLIILIWPYIFKQGEDINGEKVENAEKLYALEFTGAERDSMLNGLNEDLQSYLKINKVNIPNSVPPVLDFNPLPIGFSINKKPSKIILSPPVQKRLPSNRAELAWFSVRDLGELIRTRQITSLELTKFFLERLKKYGPTLESVITITEDLALKQAHQADKEIMAGKYRGPLHGIPYGVKDLLAVKGYPTTWGAAPYKDQVIDENATVVKKLDDAGAVLVAKLTMGALAWGDVWYGGKTRNPWDLEQGSSGSSAGPASATAAGLVPFALGTETWGSIVSPSTRCGATGLRPTFGRVSRAGAMALSWSMDKIGPICRDVEGCAIVFNSIYGPDGIDQSVRDFPFDYEGKVKPKKIRLGYLKTLFEENYPNAKNDSVSLKILESLGYELIPIELPDLPVSSLSFILSAEAASAFDDLTRSNRDDELVRQVKDAWPNVFRTARFTPAVEYIQANRVRYQLIQQMAEIFQKIDLYVAPSFGGDNLLLNNLSGHPCVVLPNGFDQKNHPGSISFIGNLYDEGRLLAVAKSYQDATDFHQKHPPLFP